MLADSQQCCCCLGYGVGGVEASEQQLLHDSGPVGAAVCAGCGLTVGWLGVLLWLPTYLGQTRSSSAGRGLVFIYRTEQQQQQQQQHPEIADQESLLLLLLPPPPAAAAATEKAAEESHDRSCGQALAGTAPAPATVLHSAVPPVQQVQHTSNPSRTFAAIHPHSYISNSALTAERL